eukprot:3878899-Pyramimonas_sp.AAC.1
MLLSCIVSLNPQSSAIRIQRTVANSRTLEQWTCIEAEERSSMQTECVHVGGVLAGYRNKCDFSIGLNMQGEATVGFLLGNFKAGYTAIAEPIGCLNVSAPAALLAGAVQVAPLSARHVAYVE